jgi:hypothetical protein
MKFFRQHTMSFQIRKIAYNVLRLVVALAMALAEAVWRALHQPPSRRQGREVVETSRRQRLLEDVDGLRGQ